MDTTANDEDLFDTPCLRYLEIRKKFLWKYWNPENWGQSCTKQRIIAIKDLKNYIKVTDKIFCKFSEEDSYWKVFEDNKDLIFDDDIFPDMPTDLRQRLVEKSLQIEPGYEHFREEKLARIIEVLEEEKEETLGSFKAFELNWLN